MRSDRGVNLHFWVENCVTSAYGRVLGLLTPGGIARSTKQDMEKVEALSAADVAPVSNDLWATTPVAQTIEAVKNELGGIYLQGKPECKHGARIWRTGTAPRRAKSGVTTAAQKRARPHNVSQFGICRHLQVGRPRYER
jgi:hypothetical protein